MYREIGNAITQWPSGQPPFNNNNHEMLPTDTKGRLAADTVAIPHVDEDALEITNATLRCPPVPLTATVQEAHGCVRSVSSSGTTIPTPYAKTLAPVFPSYPVAAMSRQYAVSVCSLQALTPVSPADPSKEPKAALSRRYAGCVYSHSHTKNQNSTNNRDPMAAMSRRYAGSVCRLMRERAPRGGELPRRLLPTLPARVNNRRPPPHGLLPTTPPAKYVTADVGAHSRLKL
ncbi:hypothetical protein Bbelb_235800 [Branchiostoma belcheri]|nr:hypothetical protein Bbelb_235800 [Branchiostoma belcheri]